MISIYRFGIIKLLLLYVVHGILRIGLDRVAHIKVYRTMQRIKYSVPSQNKALRNLYLLFIINYITLLRGLQRYFLTRNYQS
jgi:hypothetical protein